MKAECPECGCVFDAKQSSYGAAHASDWKTIPKKIKQILAIWISNDDLRRGVFTHMQLYDAMTKTGLKTSVSSFNEVRSAMLNPHVNLIHSTRKLIIPHDYHIISVVKKQQYWLNIPRAVQLLNNGGKL